LQWVGAVLDNRMMLTANATYSRNMNQPTFVDLNVDPVTRFTLPGEADRPVFVLTTSIVPSTGAIATRDGRVSAASNRVAELRSNLPPVSRQLPLPLAPANLDSRFTWGVNYTLNSVRDHASGFVSTSGNPFDVSSGRSSLDWRHQITASL